MKHLLLLLLALVLSYQTHLNDQNADLDKQKTILASGLQTVHIIYPSNSVARLDPTHDKDRPNHIGHGAKWIWRNLSEDHVPEGDEIHVESIFKSECRTGTLIIAADDEFIARINYSRQPLSGHHWQNTYRFPLYALTRGVNVLHVWAKNKPTSAAGLIYAITQQCKPYHMLRNHD